MKYYCIKQHDITDCGAACFATICRQNGYKIGINGVSMDSSVFQYGLSFEQEISWSDKGTSSGQDKESI